MNTMNKRVILRAAAAAVTAAALLTTGCLKTHTDSEGWSASHRLDIWFGEGYNISVKEGDTFV